MAQSTRRAVITGAGVLSPVGRGADAFWQSLLEGRSGVRAIVGFDTSTLPVRFGGEIADFDPKDYVEKKDRRSLKVMARTIQLAVAGAQLALEHGKVDKSKLEPERFGVEFGAGLIATELPEMADASRASVNCQPGVTDIERWGREGMDAIQPLWMLKYLPNFLASHVSILHDARGPNNSITASDVAGLLALGEAYRILCRDGADFFLVGGAESKVNVLSLVRQCLFAELSHRNDAPEKACRPFDLGRDGIVIGEGSSVLVVEDLEHARKRGATVLAEVVGFGSAFDPKLSGEGLARAIRAALSEAGIATSDVDHVNAHGLGTRQADAAEARGLHAVFADRVPVFAAKSYMGNLGAGGSLTELAASVFALRHGVLPPTLNYDEPDPDCPVRVVAGRPHAVTKAFVVKTGFTEMGQCGATVIRKWD
jgi:3-oxoacyl-[acyl-carrier-protein] synthase II